MKLHKFLILLTIALVSIMAVVIWFYPSRDDFRATNPFWNGTGDMAAGSGMTPLESLSGLSDLPPDAALITVPFFRLSGAELEEVAGFIARGGTFIIADDYGYGDQVTEYLGLAGRFAGLPLLDPLVNYKNRWFPRITHLTESYLTEDVEALVFNHGTALSGIEAGETIARSSAFSFLDTNGDQERQESEAAGTMPVISRHRVGEGTVILVADPSLFINSMETVGDNASFIRNITSAASAVYFDQDHLPESNLSRSKDRLGRLRQIFATPPGTLGVVLAAIVVTLMPLWQRRRQS